MIIMYMNNHIWIPVISAVLFSIVKYLNNKYISKKETNYNTQFTDSMMVLISVYISYFFIDKVNNSMSGGGTEVFTSPPDF